MSTPLDSIPSATDAPVCAPAKGCPWALELGMFAPLINLAMPDPLFVHDHWGRLVMANARACSSLGYSRNELLRMSVTDIEQDYDLAAAQAIWSSIQVGDARILQGRHRRKDGALIPVEVHLALLQMKGQRLYIGVARDLSERKRNEEWRRQSEERLRLFIEYAPAALAMFDREMRYLAASRRWRTDYGLGTHDLSGQSHYALFPEIGADLKAVHRRALAGETVRAEEDRFRRADGGVQWLRWETLPWYELDGSIGGIVIYSEDITARKTVEEALRTSENRLRRAQDAARLGTWEWDVQSGLSDWSDQTFRLYDLEPGVTPASYDAWLASIDPPARAAVAAQVRDCLDHSAPLDVEWRTHQGQRWLNARGQPVLDKDGRVVRYQGVVIDITERKKVYRALERTRDRLAEAQAMSHLGSFEYDVVRQHTTWSDEQYRIHGLEPGTPSINLDEILARSVDPDDADYLRASFIAAIENRRPFDQEHRLIWPDGSLHWVHTRAQPEFDEQGRLIAYIGTTQDITERKQQDEAAQRHHEVLQTLSRRQVAIQTAAAFAHELNQPLVALCAYNEVSLRLLQKENLSKENLVEVVEASHAQALRAGRVLHELLDHLHKGEAKPESFDLNMLIVAVADKVRAATSRRVKIRLALEAGLPRTLGIPLHTEKVLDNLLQNGIEAMAESGIAAATLEIAVRSHGARRMAHVTVRDAGPGLDNAKVQRMFEPFFSTKRNGLGLGLSISRALIENQGGQLWLDPEAGPGAVFHFTLPFAET